MKNHKKYKKPEVLKIPIDIKELVKSSSGGCPYVFVRTNRGYVCENNILPDSEDLLRKEKVLNDYYVLENEPSLKDGSFKIKEFENEISWFDKFDLMIIKHPKDVSIGITSRGEILNFKSPLAPLSCKSNNEEGNLNRISNYNWDNPVNYYSGKSEDYLELNFGEIDASNLKLLVVDPKDESFDVAACGVLNKKDSIHIYLWIDNKWQHITVIHTRAEFYPDIVDLTPYLSQIKKENKIKIKLEFTAHHKVSFVGLDTTPPVPLKKEIYELSQAIHSNLGDVTNTLSKEDSNLTRLTPGEEIELKFPTPQPAKPGNKLSYVLVSRGYYVPVTKLVSLSKQRAIA